MCRQSRCNRVSDTGLNSDPVQQLEDNHLVRAAPKRQRKKISPSIVKLAMEEGSIADQNALKDAESMWKMFLGPAHGGPTCPESEFSELAVRFAQRGLRWVQLELRHGITASNRRTRAESRAIFGYGILKPKDPPKVFAYHEEYGRAKQNYLTDLLEMAQQYEDGQQDED